MFIRFFCTIWIIALMLPGNPQAAPSPLPLTDKVDHLAINPYLEVLEDPSGIQELENVLTNTSGFQPLVTDTYHWERGFTRSAYWFRLRLQNHTRETDWYFMQWGSLNRSVRLYAGHGHDVRDFVELKPVPHARIFQFHLPLPQNGESSLYFRVQDKHTPLALAPELFTAERLVTWTMQNYPVGSFILGSLLMLALYNLLYGLYLRDRGFLSLAVLTLAFALEMGSHLGLWHTMAWLRNHLTATGTLAGFVCIASGISLYRLWLMTPTHFAAMDKWWRWAFWLSIGLAAMAPLMPYTVAVLGIWAVTLILAGCVNLMMFYRSGLRLHVSIVLAGMVFLLSLIPALLRTLELVSETAGLAEWPLMGLSLALMLLSLAQAEQVRQKNEQAESFAAANQAKDAFLATMSHELCSPMAAVTDVTRLLGLPPLSGQQQAYVTRLHTASRHMSALVNDILDLAHLDKQSLRIDNKPFSLDDILLELEHLLGDQARDKRLKLRISNHFHMTGKQLQGDPLRLQQILMNLLANALKFTHQGEVRLRVSPKTITAGSAATLLFEVRDTGIGISSAQMQKLFQPFSQVNSSISRQYGGSGLGLAISQKLVGLMGGELQVESIPRCGSCFFFTLVFPLQPTTHQPVAVSGVVA